MEILRGYKAKMLFVTDEHMCSDVSSLSLMTSVDSQLDVFIALCQVGDQK